MKFKFSKSIVFLLSLVMVIFLLFVAFYMSFVIRSVSSGVSFMDSLVAKPFQELTKLTTSFEEITQTKKENSDLKSILYEKEFSKNELDTLKKENVELRQLLNIDAEVNEATKLVANVINRSTVSWLDFVQVDAGQDKGISTQFLVVANGGLVGWVSNVSATTSRVNLLTNTEESKSITVKVQTQSGDIYGVLSGFDQKKNAFIIKQLNNNIDIKEGDSVSTSGLGDYPVANIPVGNVLEVSEETGGELDREVFVKPAAGFSDISVVMLIGK